MNLVYADIIEIFSKDGQQHGTVRMNGLLKKVSLMLLPGAKQGDRVLLCDGIPISKILTEKKGGHHVSGDSREVN